MQDVSEEQQIGLAERILAGDTAARNKPVRLFSSLPGEGVGFAMRFNRRGRRIWICWRGAGAEV